MGLGALPAHGGPSTSSPGTGRRTDASFGWVRVQDLLRVDASDAAVFMDTGGSIGAATVGEGEFPVFGTAEDFLQ